MRKKGSNRVLLRTVKLDIGKMWNKQIKIQKIFLLKYKDKKEVVFLKLVWQTIMVMNRYIMIIAREYRS